jgi:DNA-binding transcriptional ArsR family regulator
MTSVPESTEALDPLIHVPARLVIIATLAALPDGDALSVARLQDLLGLAPGRLHTHLGELDEAGYTWTGEAVKGGRAQTTAALTRRGRAALDHYTAELRHRPAGTTRNYHEAPHVRIGDADRDATAVALGEHFAQGRLTLDELHARLGATLTATTYGELTRVTTDLL